MTFPPLVTAVCSVCRLVRVGSTHADLRLAGWVFSEAGRCVCNNCARRERAS